MPAYNLNFELKVNLQAECEGNRNIAHQLHINETYTERRRQKGWKEVKDGGNVRYLRNGKRLSAEEFESTI